QGALRSRWSWYKRWRGLPEPIQQAEIARHDLGIRIWRLVKQIRITSDEDEKFRLTEQLSQAVSEKFDAEQAIRECRLAWLEERIKQLQAELKQRKEHREQIIEGEVERYLEGRLRQFQRKRPGAGAAPDRDD
ncbi:MAG: hypothetical protein KAU28_07925, partial [Phycisphaerae bacterium]|nr:hypothetical protein [Phycisphaerae bacterium]